MGGHRVYMSGWVRVVDYVENDKFGLLKLSDICGALGLHGLSYYFFKKSGMNLDDGLVWLKTKEDVHEMCKWVPGVRELEVYVEHPRGIRGRLHYLQLLRGVCIIQGILAEGAVVEYEEPKDGDFLMLEWYPTEGEGVSKAGEMLRLEWYPTEGEGGSKEGETNSEVEGLKNAETNPEDERITEGKKIVEGEGVVEGDKSVEGDGLVEGEKSVEDEGVEGVDDYLQDDAWLGSIPEDLGAGVDDFLGSYEFEEDLFDGLDIGGDVSDGDSFDYEAAEGRMGCYADEFEAIAALGPINLDEEILLFGEEDEVVVDSDSDTSSACDDEEDMLLRAEEDGPLEFNKEIHLKDPVIVPKMVFAAAD